MGVFGRDGEERGLVNRRFFVRKWAVVALAMATVWGPAVAGFAAGSTRVHNVRCSVQGERTRVVLDLNSRTDYKITTHKNPDRIAVNIRGVAASRSIKTRNLASGVVERVRINHLSWGTQVVLDLDKAARWKDFVLPKNGKRPDRIVLDVFDGPSYTPRAPVEPASTRRPRSDSYVVAIDAGHGGSDPGTSKVEKHFNLDMAKRIAARINAFDGFEAILTRDRDVFLNLERRVDIAASHNADAFVSIHVNWAPNRAARGTEIFFLSPRGARVTTNKVLANPSRAASEFGLSGNQNADVLHMLVDVNKQSILEKSEQLAESILESMNKNGLPPTRSVKQKAFSVLRTFETPSVLVETGFMSNAHDAKILRSERGRRTIAEAIANGIVSYFSNHPPPRGRHDPIYVHKVQRGESLWKISRKYGTSVASIRRANNLGNSSLLRPGQELIISNRY
jgi:N-acetylmuramoyl-L-alanine amidase